MYQGKWAVFDVPAVRYRLRIYDVSDQIVAILC
jgi:hypothetical protein